jgi:hypothetical protein
MKFGVGSVLVGSGLGCKAARTSAKATVSTNSAGSKKAMTRRISVYCPQENDHVETIVTKERQGSYSSLLMRYEPRPVWSLIGLVTPHGKERRGHLTMTFQQLNRQMISNQWRVKADHIARLMVVCPFRNDFTATVQEAIMLDTVRHG